MRKLRAVLHRDERCGRRRVVVTVMANARAAPTSIFNRRRCGRCWRDRVRVRIIATQAAARKGGCWILSGAPIIGRLPLRVWLVAPEGTALRDILIPKNAIASATAGGGAVELTEPPSQ